MLNPAADSSPSRPTNAADRTDTCLTVREVLSSNMFAAIGSLEQWCCQSVNAYNMNDMNEYSLTSASSLNNLKSVIK